MAGRNNTGIKSFLKRKSRIFSIRFNALKRMLIITDSGRLQSQHAVIRPISHTKAQRAQRQGAEDKKIYVRHLARAGQNCRYPAQ